MEGAREVRFHDLFWRTLDDHRGQSHYTGLRRKIAWFIERKREIMSPVSPRDNYFGAIKSMAGIWHFSALRNPDVVVFYTVGDRCLNLAMVGSHTDYPYNGKNFRAAARTAQRVNGSVQAGPVPTPGWKTLRWSDPKELLDHPDLNELSASGLDTLSSELLNEMDDGGRYLDLHGIPVENASVSEFDRYFDTLVQARDMVLTLREKKWTDRRSSTDLSMTKQTDLSKYSP